jgi:TolB-like protein|tara:strand:- start:308 stop:904 length:597 start_codon:yes stop_codon:yes gene_type:complete
LFIISCLFSQVSRYNAKPTVAVFSFEQEGLQQEDYEMFMELLKSELQNTKALIMVDQNQIDEVILEKNYQNRECKSQDCGIEIGKLIGIKNIIVGSLNQVADTCKIQAQLVNVIEGETEKSVEKTHIGDINEILPKIEIAAWELANLEPTQDMLSAAGLLIEDLEEKPNDSRWPMWLNKAVNYIANRWQGFLSLFTKE